MPPAKKTSTIIFNRLEGGYVTHVGEIFVKSGNNTISFQTVKRIARQISLEDNIPIEVTWIPDKERRVTLSKPAIISVIITGDMEDAMSVTEQFSDIASERGLS